MVLEGWGIIEAITFTFLIFCYLFLKTPSSDFMNQLQHGIKPPWENDMYMQPVDPDDLLLQYGESFLLGTAVNFYIVLFSHSDWI